MGYKVRKPKSLIIKNNAANVLKDKLDKRRADGLRQGRYFMKRLIDGLSGWLLFKQACMETTLYSEAYLYQPIHDLAKGRKWDVLAQESVDVGEFKGKIVDFVFLGHRFGQRGTKSCVIVAEVKYIKWDNSNVDGKGLEHDLAKMRAIKVSDLRHRKMLLPCLAVLKYEVVIIQEKALHEIFSYCGRQTNTYRDVSKILIDAMDGTSQKGVIHRCVESKAKPDCYWHVYAFEEKAWP